MGGSSASNVELLALAWSLGWRVAAGLFVGYLLDNRMGTGPLLTLLFSLGALTSGVVQILHVLRASSERREPPAR